MWAEILEILMGFKYKLKVCSGVFWNQTWSIQVGSFFWALIQEGWIRIVASHRGLPRAFTKVTDVGCENCELSDMLLALALNLGGTITLNHRAFPSLWTPWEKTKMGGNSSLFLNVFKYCASFPVFMFSPASDSPLPPARTLLSFVWAPHRHLHSWVL